MARLWQVVQPGTVPQNVLFVLKVSWRIISNYQWWLRPAVCRITTTKELENHKAAWDEKTFVTEQLEKLAFHKLRLLVHQVLFPPHQKFLGFNGLWLVKRNGLCSPSFPLALLPTPYVLTKNTEGLGQTLEKAGYPYFYLLGQWGRH